MSPDELNRLIALRHNVIKMYDLQRSMLATVSQINTLMRHDFPNEYNEMHQTWLPTLRATLGDDYHKVNISVGDTLEKIRRAIDKKLEEDC